MSTILNFRCVVLLPGFLLGSASLYWCLSHSLWLPVLLLWAAISGLGIAVGFHRIYSHRTHRLHPWLDNLILFFGSIAGQGSSITWVAVHRGYHHRSADTPRDLHSPIHGVWHSFLGWYSLINESTINHKYAVDLLRKPNHVWVHKQYLSIHLQWVVTLLGVTLLTSIPVFHVYMACLFLSLLQDNLVNTLCHLRWLGYKNKNFESADNSVNVPVFGYLTWGQGWHSNHHADPAAFSFRKRWWEFDPSVLWLPLIKIGEVNERTPSASEGDV
jgi:fatty-acid desaturase